MGIKVRFFVERRSELSIVLVELPTRSSPEATSTSQNDANWDKFLTSRINFSEEPSTLLQQILLQRYRKTGSQQKRLQINDYAFH